MRCRPAFTTTGSNGRNKNREWIGFGITWTASLVAEHTVAAVPALYAWVSRAAELAIDVDYLWVYPPYVTGGVFESCAVDAGGTVIWQMASWSATLPTGGSVQVATRTSLDGQNWSPWSAPLDTSGSAITSPPGQYLQYQLSLTSQTPDTSPVVDAVTVSWTAGGSNQAPVATPQAVTTAEDTAVAVTLAGTDPDGDALIFAVVTSPAHGTLSGSTPNLTYTPAANYHGADSFTFTATDGAATSAPVTVATR